MHVKASRQQLSQSKTIVTAQYLDRLRIIPLHRNVQRSLAIVVSGIHSGSVAQQYLSHLPGPRNVQRRLAIVGFSIHSGSVA